MGVHGLWELLAPVGRRVSVETLAGKKLAIGTTTQIPNPNPNPNPSFLNKNSKFSLQMRAYGWCSSWRRCGTRRARWYGTRTCSASSAGSASSCSSGPSPSSSSTAPPPPWSAAPLSPAADSATTRRPRSARPPRSCFSIRSVGCLNDRVGICCVSSLCIYVFVVSPIWVFVVKKSCRFWMLKLTFAFCNGHYMAVCFV